MRTRSLIGTHDGLLVEQGCFGAAHQLTFPSGPKDRLAAFHVCRFSTMAFGEHVISVCSFKTSKKKFLNKHTETCLRKNNFSGMAAQDSDSTAIETFEVWEEDDDYDKELTHYRGLVLDVSYRPINIVCWKRALCLEILEKADVLEYYDQVINSASRAFAIPAVLRITDYVDAPKRITMRLALKRKNILLRDKYKCQPKEDPLNSFDGDGNTSCLAYSGACDSFITFFRSSCVTQILLSLRRYCNAQDNLTVDHVVPISQGGGFTWQNLVTACSRCNLRKGDKTLSEANMHLLKPPKEPHAVDLRDMPSKYTAYRTLNSSNKLPNEWIDYLPKHRPAFDHGSLNNM